MLQIFQDFELIMRNRGHKALNSALAIIRQEYDRFTRVTIHDDCCAINVKEVNYNEKYAVFVSILFLGKGC